MIQKSTTLPLSVFLSHDIINKEALTEILPENIPSYNRNSSEIVKHSVEPGATMTRNILIATFTE